MAPKSPRHALSKSSNIIVLSDGSEWIVKNSSVEECISGILANWQVGDEVRIALRTADKYQGKFILKNVINEVTYLVDLKLDSRAQSDGHHISRLDENGYALVTKDGLEFIFGWLGACSVQYWKNGDRIIINKAHFSSKEDYLIINAHNGASAWGSLVSWK